MILQAVVGGFVLDALFGDPAWLPHPVVLMGRCISRLEKFLRARLPGTPQGELLGGAVTAFCLPVGTFLVTSLVCLAAAKLSPWLGLAVQMFWCGQALAARGLAQELQRLHGPASTPRRDCCSRCFAASSGMARLALLMGLNIFVSSMYRRFAVRTHAPLIMRMRVLSSWMVRFHGFRMIPLISGTASAASNS